MRAHRASWRPATLVVTMALVGVASAVPSPIVAGSNEALATGMATVIGNAFAKAGLQGYFALFPVPQDVVDDLIADVTGTAPPATSGTAADMAELVQLVTTPLAPADVSLLRETCETPPERARVFCPPGGLPDGPLELVAFQFANPLPTPWPPGIGLYTGFLVATTPDPSDDLTDDFHAGTNAVYMIGWFDDGSTPFIEGMGDPSRPPYAALFPDLGVGLVALPVSMLQNGFRVVSSLVDPASYPFDGRYDQVGPAGGPADGLLSPFRPFAVPGPLGSALGFPAAADGPPVLTYPDPVDALFPAYADLAATEGLLASFPASPGTLLGDRTACGSTIEGALLVCGGGDLPAGPAVVIRGTVGAPLIGPDAAVDPAAQPSITLALDADADPGTGHPGGASDPADPLAGTDRWYQVGGAPDWQLTVTDGAANRDLSATSGARALIDGSTVTWVIPATELGTPLPGWRVIASATDAAGAVLGDVSSGGPGTDWQLQPLDDPLGLTVIHYAKPTVIGGCVTAVPGQPGGLPLTLDWQIRIGGIEGMEHPTLELAVTFPNGSASTSGVPVVDGVATPMVSSSPGKVTFKELTLSDGGGKPTDLGKSWRSVFGKSLKVTKDGGQTAGPDCP